MVKTECNNKKYIPKIRELRLEGDPVLRKKCRKLARTEILSPETQRLIEDIKFTCSELKYGVGMSASQVGEPIALSVISIKSLSGRSDTVPFEEVCFNLEIVKTIGNKVSLWEGCCSTLGDDGLPVYAQVPRYKKVHIKYLDRDARLQERTVEGFVAHVAQHETDHVNGILFTDYVDRNDLISTKEYLERVKKITS